MLGTFPNDINKIIRQLKKLSSDLSLLRVCYEAGPIGFGLSRCLKKEGIDRIAVAPTLVPQKAGLRVKTDRRDSRKLGHYLRSGDLTQVWVPDEQTEALRDLERTRDDAKNAERTARHQLSKLLLRNDRAYRDGREWTATRHPSQTRQPGLLCAMQPCIFVCMVDGGVGSNVPLAASNGSSDTCERRCDGARDSRVVAMSRVFPRGT